MAKLKIVSVVFLSGACLMAMELTGSRVLAPYVGTSIFVWSSLIGVILGCLSLGSWIGGMLADRYRSPAGLAWILVIAGLGVLISTAFKDALMYGLHPVVSGLQMRSFTGAIILFAVPSLLLGMVTPYAIRLALGKTEQAGRVVGNLVAVSTLGSIVGTLATGFVLTPLLGSTRIMMLIVMVLAGNALIMATRKQVALDVGILALLIISAIGLYQPGKLVFGLSNQVTDIETQYSRVWIYDRTDSAGRSLKVLRINNEVNSAMYNDSDELVYPYLKFFHLADRFSVRSDSVLLIGGGAFSFPMDFIRSRPQATIDVVEIDPKLEDLARRFFRLEKNPRLKIHHEDGRIFLNRAQGPYDVVLVDAFQSLNVIPFQLATLEAAQRIAGVLHNDGVVMVNIIGSLEGPGSRFLCSELKVYQSVFKNVYLFPLLNPDNSRLRQNIMLVATNSAKAPEWTRGEPWGDQMLQRLWTKPLPDTGIIYTDDFAPVEYAGWLER